MLKYKMDIDIKSIRCNMKMNIRKVLKYSIITTIVSMISITSQSKYIDSYYDGKSIQTIYIKEVPIKDNYEENSTEAIRTRYKDINSIFPYSNISIGLLDLMYRVSYEEGIDVNLLISMVFAESNFNKNLVSPAGAVGLIQLMPDTAREMGLIVNETIDERYDAEKNLRAGIRYFKKIDAIMQNHFHKSETIELAIAAYNAGPGNVLKYKEIPPFDETERHVEKILEYKGKLENIQ